MSRAIALSIMPLDGCDASEDPSPAIGSCASGESDADPYVDCVEALVAVEGTDFGHADLPEIVLGPPGGSLDVASLGCGGSITLYFDDPVVVDGPGPDLLVFENPFSTDFPEPGRVAVSEDGERWHTFECDPAALVGCAGLSPVEATPGRGLDPTDPEAAGGDAFDLAALGLSRARFVRIEDTSAAYWAEQGADYCDPGQGGKGGFDLDAVAAVHVEG